MPQAPGPSSSSSPVPAPAEAPRILRKPGPLAPPSLDGLPRATTQSMAALSTTPSARPVAEPASNREVTQPFIVHPGDGATQVAPWPPRPVAPSALTAPIKTHMPAPTPAPPASAAAVVDTEPMRTIPGLQAPPPFVPKNAAQPVDTQPMLTLAAPSSPTAPTAPAPRATMPTVPPLAVTPVAPSAATVVRRVDAEATAIVAPPSPAALPAPPPLAVTPVAPPVVPAPTPAAREALAFEATVVAPKSSSAVVVAAEPTLVAPPPPAPPAAPAAPRFAPALPTPAQVVTDALPVIPPPAAAPAPAPRFAPALPTPAQVVTDVLPTIKAPAAALPVAPPAASARAGTASPATDAARPAWAAPAKTAVPDAVKPRRLEYASWWRQWGAALVDGVGSAALVFGLVRLVLLALSIKPSVQGLVDALHHNVLQLAPVAAAWPVGVALWHLLALAFGSTLGQRLLGLRLVDSRGHRAGPLRLVIRALVAGATSVFLIGPAWALLVDGRRRGCGDIIARTAAIHR